MIQTYEVEVFSRQYDDKGRITAQVLHSTEQVEAESPAIAQFIAQQRVLAAADVDSNDPVAVTAAFKQFVFQTSVIEYRG